MENVYVLMLKGQSRTQSIFIKQLKMYFVAKDRKDALLQAKMLISYMDKTYLWGYSVQEYI